MRQESKVNPYTRFLTLTYRDEDLPVNVDDDGVCHPTVSKDDVTLWLRRMWNSGMKFRYFITSEYGSRTLRPHYHAIMWSKDLNDYLSYWKFGDNNCDVPAKTSAMKYVLKYILKGSKVPEGGDPNFRRMSRVPGIGSSFVYKGDPYILDRGGVKLVPGHYYRRNYLNSLDEKVGQRIRDGTLQYLFDRDPDEYLRKRWYEVGSPGDFDDWKSRIYLKDYNKQVKINSKHVDI